MKKLQPDCFLRQLSVGLMVPECRILTALREKEIVRTLFLNPFFSQNDNSVYFADGMVYSEIILNRLFTDANTLRLRGAPLLSQARLGDRY